MCNTRETKENKNTYTNPTLSQVGLFLVVYTKFMFNNTTVKTIALIRYLIKKVIRFDNDLKKSLVKLAE